MIKMIKEKIVALVNRVFMIQHLGDKLPLTMAFSVYIALSPFVFFHTIMVVIISWLFGLNMGYMFMVTNTINNPWTMVPIYAFGYWVGGITINLIYGVNTTLLNPSWMSGLNQTLRTYIGVPEISFWSFIIGGNLLGILFSGIVYVVIKYLCGKRVDEK